MGAVTVDAAVDLLSEETQDAVRRRTRTPAASSSKAPLYNNPPVESDEFVTQTDWTDAWQEIKAGA